jgi:hypothetical protein
MLVPLYCGIFNTLPIKVAAPLVPVVVKVISPPELPVFVNLTKPLLITYFFSPITKNKVRAANKPNPAYIKPTFFFFGGGV